MCALNKVKGMGLIMKKVTAVGKYGNVVIDEVETKGEEITHDKMIYNMFKDVLKPLIEAQESIEGDLINIWSNAGLVTKYLDMMIYLETIHDDAIINHPICIIPQAISESQLNYYEDNYLHSIDTFIPLYYNGEKFKLLSEHYFDSEELYNAIKSKLIANNFSK